MRIAIAASFLLASGVVCAEVEHRETTTRTYPLPAGARLSVENTNGRVLVRTHSGGDVRLTVEEHWRADSPEELAEGRAATKVEAVSTAAGLRIFVDEPCNCGGGRLSWGRRGYRVRFDFIVDAPAGAPLSLSSLNGEIEAEFPPSLAADFRLRTFHGQVYTDFDITALPGGAPRFERAAGKRMYRADPYTGIRIGSGGVEHRLETLNGNIRILKTRQLEK